MLETLKFADLLATLKRLEPWLKELGIDPKNDRIHSAIDVLRQAEAISKAGRKPPEGKESERFYFGLIEAIEIHDIFLAFEKAASPGVKDKLARALSGPHHPADETPRNSDGRNIMFELSLAAELLLRGVPRVEVGEPDIALRVGPNYFFECKRPENCHSLRSSIRAAARQLKRNLEQHEGACGVVAISTSRIFNRGDKLFVTNSGESGLKQLGELLKKVARSSEPTWPKAEMHPNICGLLFHVSTPAILKAERLITKLSYAQMFSVGKETEQAYLLRKIMETAWRT